MQALAQAVVLLNSEGIALDSPLGDVQKAHRAGTAFAVHGGNSHEGIANLQVTRPYIESPIFSGNNDRLGDSKTLSSSGYNIAHGSSFIMTLNFTDEAHKLRLFCHIASQARQSLKILAIKPHATEIKNGEIFILNAVILLNIH